MSIKNIAGKHSLSVVARVASEDDTDLEQINAFKKVHKNASKAIASYWYLFVDTANHAARTVFVNAGFNAIKESFNDVSIDSSIKLIAWFVRRNPGTEIGVIKLSGYTDKPRLIVSHAQSPLNKLEEDYKSNGPITRALAAYHAAQVR